MCQEAHALASRRIIGLVRSLDDPQPVRGARPKLRMRWHALGIDRKTEGSQVPLILIDDSVASRAADALLISVPKAAAFWMAGVALDDAFLSALADLAFFGFFPGFVAALFFPVVDFDFSARNSDLSFLIFFFSTSTFFFDMATPPHQLDRTTYHFEGGFLNDTKSGFVTVL